MAEVSPNAQSLSPRFDLSLEISGAAVSSGLATTQPSEDGGDERFARLSAHQGFRSFHRGALTARTHEFGRSRPEFGSKSRWIGRTCPPLGLKPPATRRGQNLVEPRRKVPSARPEPFQDLVPLGLRLARGCARASLRLGRRSVGYIWGPALGKVR